jgi:uncharacterized protein YndB with AHSA1/START domain
MIALGNLTREGSRVDEDRLDDEIRYSVALCAAPEVVAAALSEAAHLAGWWTREVAADGDRLRLDWGGHGWQVDLAVTVAPDRRQVDWRCLRSNLLDSGAWEGTTLGFGLTPTAEGTRLDFLHAGYPPSPCRAICAPGWAFFLGNSLKAYLETGTGMPYPDMPGQDDALAAALAG